MAWRHNAASVFLHRNGQLVFLTEEERARLAQINLCDSEPSDSSLLERLFSSDISSVYRLGKVRDLLLVRVCRVSRSRLFYVKHVCIS